MRHSQSSRGTPCWGGRGGAPHSHKFTGNFLHAQWGALPCHPPCARRRTWHCVACGHSRRDLRREEKRGRGHAAQGLTFSLICSSSSSSLCQAQERAQLPLRHQQMGLQVDAGQRQSPRLPTFHSHRSYRLCSSAQNYSDIQLAPYPSGGGAARGAGRVTAPYFHDSPQVPFHPQLRYTSLKLHPPPPWPFGLGLGVEERATSAIWAGPTCGITLPRPNKQQGPPYTRPCFSGCPHVCRGWMGTSGERSKL